MANGKIIDELCKSIEMLKACGVEPTVLRVPPKSYQDLLPFLKSDGKGDAPVVKVNGATLKVVLDSMAVPSGTEYVTY